jgi:hypothetical protein
MDSPSGATKDGPAAQHVVPLGHPIGPALDHVSDMALSYYRATLGAGVQPR